MNDAAMSEAIMRDDSGTIDDSFLSTVRAVASSSERWNLSLMILYSDKFLIRFNPSSLLLLWTITDVSISSSFITL